MSKKTVLIEVSNERTRQDRKWGELNYENGTGGDNACQRASIARDWCNMAHAEGRCTWRHILDEEVKEAFAEEDRQRLRAELIHVAAVAVNWIECIDRKAKER